MSIYTFCLQYPGFLFPGETQYSDKPPPKDLKIDFSAPLKSFKIKAKPIPKFKPVRPPIPKKKTIAKINKLLSKSKRFKGKKAFRSGRHIRIGGTGLRF